MMINPSSVTRGRSGRALSGARVEPISDPEGFLADVAEVRGARGFGETTEEALIDLEAGLEGWIDLKVADGGR